MIQEPARVQDTTYDAQAPISGDSNPLKEKNCSPNCKHSPARTERTASWTGTTIPIVINSHPHPRIILIKVPAYSNQSNQSSNSSNPSNQSNQSKSNQRVNSKCNRAESTVPRTRLIRIPFLPGPVPTPSSVKRASPTTNVSVNYTTPATASRTATPALSQTGIIYPPARCSNNSYSQLNQVASDQMVGPPTTLPTTTELVTETVKVSSSSQSQTLAAMAGIQLTGADMESRRDMSGAMPTATVEEIDVPVFIDEYLQNIEASSSTSCSSESEENGKKICTETDIIDFDFDINLFAEDLIERKEMDQCNLDLDMNYNSDNSDIIDNLTDGLTLMGEEVALDMGVLSNGIDFTQEEQLDLDNILIADPMLGVFSQGLSSQTKYFDELPMLADENSSDTTYNQCSQNSLGFGLGQVEAANDVQVGLAVQEVHPTTLCGVNLKRTASTAGLVPKVESMPPKRNKLILNINRSLNIQAETINTPDIIEQVLNLDEQNSANISTQDIIYQELRNTEENTASTSYAELSPPNTPYSAYSVSSTSHSRSYAPTPSQFTAPVSPAFSNASTSQFSASTSTSGSKRKRGRPAKEHSDGPDPELMSRLKPEELKLYCDRMKNNEASRISRRKTKKREDEEKLEEELLQEENVRLTAILNKVLDRKKRHEDYLKQWHHRHSTYVKPEPEH